MAKIKRKSISKKVREEVYQKFNGHCAYCGQPLTISEMQVDHVIPFRNLVHGKNSESEIEAISNLYPACRLCNWAKRSKSVESFRKYLQKILGSLQKSAIYRLAIKYNLIQELPHKIIFYFEKNLK